MKQYRIFLRGENFLLEADGQLNQLGFYTTRFVEATGPEAAEILAIDLIRRDETLAGVKNTRDNPPMIYAEEIEEISVDELLPGSGYTFFQIADGAGEA